MARRHREFFRMLRLWHRKSAARFGHRSFASCLAREHSTLVDWSFSSACCSHRRCLRRERAAAASFPWQNRSLRKNPPGASRHPLLSSRRDSSCRRVECPTQFHTPVGVANQSALVHSRCADQRCYSAMAFGGRRCRCCASRSIPDPADASSCHVPESNPDRDSTALCNRPVPSGSKPPPALRDPFRKHENVLCPGDLDSARASLRGDFPVWWLIVAAYLPCSARAYGMILHCTYRSTIMRIYFE